MEGPDLEAGALHSVGAGAEQRAPSRVERLSTRGFRNLGPLDLTPGPSFNVIHGDNGAGKSNLLEAIHYLSALRSFRGAKTDDMIALGEQRAAIHARVSGDAAPRTFRVALSRGQSRKLLLDEKRPRSLAVWQEALTTVLFHPGHLSVTAGGAEGRRAFLDRILEQTGQAHAKRLSEYQKALRSRNRMLKAERCDRNAIRAFDEILARTGEEIARARHEITEDLAPRTVRAFEFIVGEDKPLALRYAPRHEPTREALSKALEESFDKDRARGFTGVGPHGDDLEVTMREVHARHHASQGQHRAMVLALKVAEAAALTDRVGRVPILLLDDVSSELDRTRNRRLFALLGALGGQVFMTTTHPEFILIERDRVDFEVREGRVERGD